MYSHIYIGRLQESPLKMNIVLYSGSKRCAVAGRSAKVRAEELGIIWGPVRIPASIHPVKCLMQGSGFSDLSFLSNYRARPGKESAFASVCSRLACNTHRDSEQLHGCVPGYRDPYCIQGTCQVEGLFDKFQVHLIAFQNPKEAICYGCAPQLGSVRHVLVGERCSKGINSRIYPKA